MMYNQPSCVAVESNRHLFIGCDRSYGTIMAPYLRSFFLIPSTLDAYCMCTCANDTDGLEGLPQNPIRLMACITGDGAALCLGRSESSFVRSAINDQHLRVSTTFRDLNHSKCAHSVLSTVMLRSRRAHSPCEAT